MLEPVGPLPPSIYWRRRAVAVVVVVILLALTGWAVGAAASAGGTEEVAAPTPAPAAPPSPVSSRSALAVPPGGAGPLLGSASPGGATPPLLGAGATGPQVPAQPSSAPAPRAAAAPAPACRDGALKVAARTDKDRYTTADRPLFSLVVTNTGTAPCSRDLGPARTAMAVVVKAGDGLWGSDDCAPGGDPDVRTLVPGQEQVLSVRWAGRTSLPGCPSGREAVPAGTYQLLTRLDGTVSTPATFRIAS